MLRDVHDHALPSDHGAFVAGGPPGGRIIVIAPTRAACETIELALALRLDTVLEREHGAEIRALARDRRAFGIVAGTGTGKTLAIRPIAEELLGTTGLRVGVVNREREATPETPTWNVIIVTTGIARRWFEDGDILPADTLVVDEIHQTSAELELCLALGRRVGCRFIWLSATVDPRFYARYLNSAAVIDSRAFDAARAATVRVVRDDVAAFLSDRFLQHVVRRRRGVGVFLPTRAAVESVAADVAARFPRITAAFYHGGEPIRVIRPFLEDGVAKPYLLAMTAAGQSSINVKGLDTVVIDDSRFANVVEKGRNVLTRLHLGANEILQMAGRVHGRVENGEVFILSDRDLHFDALQPTEPEFQLAGDSERVAITCAALGVRADALELPVPLDRRAYRSALALLEERGIVSEGRLTRYGRLVEATPVERPWAELLVHADDGLLPYVAVMASTESLHRMTREDRDLSGLVVPGSDHLTAYNVYADAYTRSGYVGQVYGLARHLFDEGTIAQWAERRGVLVRAIEDSALAVASVCRALEVELPRTLPRATDEVRRGFCELVARVMPFALVIDEETVDGQEARVSRSSVCGSWGAIAGDLRYFADRFGIPRASIEGTQLPMSLVRKHAVRESAELAFDPTGKRDRLVLRSRVSYFGFELERAEQPVGTFPVDQGARARRLLAEALASGEARHPAVRRYRQVIEETRELFRRSGGTTPRLGIAELAAMYETALSGVMSMEEYRAAPLRLRLDELVPEAERERLRDLPDAVELRGKWIGIEYDLEESGAAEQADASESGRGGAGDAGGSGVTAVARLRLPEKLARVLTADELPALDRPLRFVVTRGARGAVRAPTLEAIRRALDEPSSTERPAVAGPVARPTHPRRQRPEERRLPRGRGRRRR